MTKITKHEHGSIEAMGSAALYVLGTMPETERAEFESHVTQGCPICDAEISRVSAVLGTLSKATTGEIPSGMRTRFLSRLEKEIPRVFDDVARDALPPGILFEASGVLIARPELMDWQPGGVPGLWAKPLFVDEQRKCATSIVWMEAGVHYPSHRHHGPEELFLVSGDLTVEGLKMKPGDYCRAEPGSIHGESYTESGCMFLLAASQRDEVLS